MEPEAEFLYQEGLSRKENQHLEEAIASFRACLERSPNTPTAWFHIGASLAALGRHAEALSAYQTYLRYDPSDAETFYLIAESKKALDLREEAIEAYKEACRISGEDGAYYFEPLGELFRNKGMVLTELWRLNEAKKALEQALVLNPEDGYAHHALGIVYSHQQQWEKALVCFQQAFECEPTSVNRRISIGRTHFLLKHFEEALEVFMEVFNNDKTNVEILREVGKCFYERQHWKEAEAIFQVVLQSNPEDASARYALARTLQDMGRRVEAVRELTLVANSAHKELARKAQNFLTYRPQFD